MKKGIILNVIFTAACIALLIATIYGMVFNVGDPSYSLIGVIVLLPCGFLLEILDT